MFTKMYFAIFLFFCFVQQSHSQNIRPVIGILTQPTSGIPAFVSHGSSFIPASYVKWLESAGAMVVPVPFDSDEPTLTAVFDTLNGLLLPGGEVKNLPNSSYFASSQILYNLALKSNKAGDVFPVWGTGQGFAQLLLMTSGQDNILEPFSIEGISSPLVFQSYYKNSSLFSSLDFTPELYYTLTLKPACQCLYDNSISPTKFSLSSTLSSFFTLLTVNNDSNNKTYVSTIEGLTFPIFGTLWHPERNQFEWDSQEKINFDKDVIRCTQYLSNLFIDKARASKHVYKTVYYDLIESSTVTYTLNIYRYYVSTYFFQ